MLLPTILLMAVATQGLPTGPAMEECCSEKTVGGDRYINIGSDPGTAWSGLNCLSACIFQKDGEDGSKYCFASGDMKVECKEDMEVTPRPGGLTYGPMTAAPGAVTAAPGAVTAAPGATTETPDDDVTLRVKGYIDSETCGTVSSNGVCGSSATSYYREFQYNGQRVIVTNQVPDHPHEQDQVFTNPNSACERLQYIALPLGPAKGASSTRTGLGSIGVAVTGGAFFNDWSDPNGKVAMSFEGRSLDSCFGHSAKAGSYHYHANINCTDAGAATGAADPDICKLIGYYRDGVPVYGLCRDAAGRPMTSCYTCTGSCSESVTHVSGTYSGLGGNSEDYSYDSAAFAAGSCNLDMAGGAVHAVTGQYSYFMTTSYPWVPIYYFGDQGLARFCSAN